MNKLLLVFTLVAVLFSGCTQGGPADVFNVMHTNDEIQYLENHPLVESAREQIGVVTQYDTGYYSGGYPPEDRGACTDVIAQALRANNYDLKAKIDQDMAVYPERYPNESDTNINFRRVRNVKVFLDYHAENLSLCTDIECFEDGKWQAGDIVTFDQIPGSLWHIAIVSNKVKLEDFVRIPYLIHNYGRGVVEDDMLLNWPAPITGHYRVDID
jgi:uncharacterized protein